MNQQGRRAALGIGPTIATVMGAAILVLGVGSCAPESEATIDVATESRTPIEVASLGPQIGEQVPDFSLPDQNGEIWTRQSIMGPQGAMLVFVRSADW